MSDSGKRRWPRRLIAFVVFVAVVLIVLDRGGNFVAERITADNLQSSQQLDQRPDVSIDGLPFVTQFASGHYEHVTLDAQDVHVARTSLYLSNFHADFRAVTVSHNFQDFHAGRASANATISYANLSRLLHVTVRYAGGGRLQISKTLPIIGRKTITFRASYANGGLTFGKLAVNGLGSLGSDVTSKLKDVFDIKAPLQGIPFKVKVRSLDVDRSGLEISLRGADLTYRNGGT